MPLLFTKKREQNSLIRYYIILYNFTNYYVFIDIKQLYII